MSDGDLNRALQLTNTAPSAPDRNRSEAATETTRISAAEYVRLNYQPSDNLALLLINRKTGERHQFVRRAHAIAGEKLQSWLRFKNAGGFDVFISQNALHEGATGRTKADVMAVRHVYLDVDRDGDRALAAIRASQAVPQPNFVINTSPGKYQVIWKVDGITPEQAESLQRSMVREFGADPAATDSTRVLRLPGLYNKKYEPHYRTDVEAVSNKMNRLDDFKLSEEHGYSANHEPSQNQRRAVGADNTQSDHDWRWVTRRLREGRPPAEVIQRLAEYRDDKPNPDYYARITVTKAYARVAVERGDNPEEVVRKLAPYAPRSAHNGEHFARVAVQEALQRTVRNTNYQSSEPPARHRGQVLGLRITP
jgi:hypothetical protein